mmetsp:Transcript_34938/g.39617  ORF Transcript_34938/g.39617 Transcript_34938/m.39617 type:complete len:89 (-) Transcript_34938:298-564(-)
MITSIWPRKLLTFKSDKKFEGYSRFLLCSLVRSARILEDDKLNISHFPFGSIEFVFDSLLINSLDQIITILKTEERVRKYGNLGVFCP